MHREETLAGVVLEIPASVRGYTLRQTIGKGKYSIVKVGEREDQSQMFAVKIIPISTQDSNHVRNQMQYSLKMSAKFNHPNVMKVYDSFEESSLLFVICEYCEKRSLFDVISSAGKLSEAMCRKYFIDIIKAVCYFHSMSFVHRSISFKAFVVDINDNVKIRHFENVVQITQHQLLSAQCGSPIFSPPEVIMNTPYEGKKVDMWGLGVILYTMAAGEIPWREEDPSKLFEKICTGQFHIPSHFSVLLGDLISGLLEVDPRRRLEGIDITRHPWVVTERCPTRVQRRPLQSTLCQSMVVFQKCRQNRLPLKPRASAVRHMPERGKPATTGWLLPKLHRNAKEDV